MAPGVARAAAVAYNVPREFCFREMCIRDRCVLAAGAGDFSLALAGAFLGAGVERFQVLGDGNCEERCV